MNDKQRTVEILKLIQGHKIEECFLFTGVLLTDEFYIYMRLEDGAEMTFEATANGKAVKIYTNVLPHSTIRSLIKEKQIIK